MSERLRLEGAFVPTFRRGVFDRLDERTSPFNLARDVVVPGSTDTAPDRVQVNPPRGWPGASGGGRLEATVGRVDASVSVYRGFDGLGPVGIQTTLDPASAQIVAQLVEFHPRFTMLGGDVETVSGPWVFRGEVAAFVDRFFLTPARPNAPSTLAPGHAIDAGAGFDRRLGEWRLVGSGLIHRQWSDEDSGLSRTDVNVIGSLDRSFRADRYRARVFAVINPADAAAFVRGIWTWKIGDAVSFDASAGAFVGSSDDTIGRFKERDFMLTRVRYDF
jgi:hypothetical protein